MPAGYPDYASPIGEVYPYQSGIPCWITAESVGEIAAGASEAIDVLTVPAGYIMFAHTCVCSAKGTDTIHKVVFSVAGVTQKQYFFGDNLVVPLPGQLIAKAGETVTATFYNYDAVARKMILYGYGTLATTGTEPLKPDYSDKPKPELKEGESLWLVQNPVDGKKWVIVKPKKIEEE